MNVESGAITNFAEAGTIKNGGVDNKPPHEQREPEKSKLNLSKKNTRQRKEYNKLYYQKNKDRINARATIYQKKNRERVLEYNRRYQRKNRDEINARNDRYRQENMCKRRVQDKVYYNENKDKILERKRRRREERKGEQRKVLQQEQPENIQIFPTLFQK